MRACESACAHERAWLCVCARACVHVRVREGGWWWCRTCKGNWLRATSPSGPKASAAPSTTSTAGLVLSPLMYLRFGHSRVSASITMHLCATNNGSGGRTAKKVQMPDFASVALPLSLQDGLAHCGAAFHSIASHAVRRLAVGRSQKADFRGGHGSLSIPLSAAPRCELLDGAYLEQVTGYLRCTEGAPLVLPRCVPAQDGGFALGQTATVYLTFTPSGYAYRPSERVCLPPDSSATHSASTPRRLPGWQAGRPCAPLDSPPKTKYPGHTAAPRAAVRSGGCSARRRRPSASSLLLA